MKAEKAERLRGGEKACQVAPMTKRLWRSQVDDIDVIDDIEALDHIEPRKKAEVALLRKRAEVLGMRMQGFGFRD